ncbi:hypothetical protein D3C75_1119290 [compost metagenome]
MATAQPPSTTVAMSTPLSQGRVKVGRPWGKSPSTLTPWLLRSKKLTARVARITTMRMLGSRSKRLSNRISARLPPPTAKLYQLALPVAMASTRCHRSSRGPSPSMEMPNSLGVWAISTTRAMTFM